MDRIVFKLPDLGEGVVEAEVVQWHVKSGDVVEEDQPLVDVMTDKATVTIPSSVSGQVVSTHGEIGEVIPVGGELIKFDVAEGEASTSSPAAKTVHAPELVGSAATASTSPPTSSGRTIRSYRPPAVDLTSATSRADEQESLKDRPLASPAVRRRAREKGVDLANVSGTGRGGRITDADIENHLVSQTGSTAGPRRVKKTATHEVHIAGLRRRIAEKMTVSKAHIPHFSYIEQVDITELSQLRHFMNDRRTSDEPKLSYLPFIMLALVKVLQKHPEANALHDDQREVVTRYDAVHLGIATQTERGLYVPVVQHVEALDLWEAARELKRVTQAVHHNTVKRSELTGSTFTVTSLGVMGGLAATPIINYPEVAILGVHKASDRPVVINGQIVVRHMVNLSASFDHRVVDGAQGAALIQLLKDYLEHPATIFL